MPGTHDRMSPSTMPRRGFLALVGGSALALAGCGGISRHGASHGATGAAQGATGAATAPLPSATAAAPTGAIGVERRLRAAPGTVSLGGRSVETWLYGDSLAEPALRVRAGERVRVTLDNALPEPTTIHWHGIRIANAMDGLPGMTQPPVEPGGSFVYDFVAPDPGTYFFHPHVGTQPDRGLYLPLIVDDPAEPLAYDEEAVVVLDDWLDGIDGQSPELVLESLRSAGGHAMHGMSGMDGMDGMGGMSGMSGMDGMGMGAATDQIDGGGTLGSDGGDVIYPLHLANGRPPDDPGTITAPAGARVRLRLINAAADTAYRVALSDHRLLVTHADGWPVEPTEVDALVIGMGERYDVLVDLASGVHVLVAQCEGKDGGARIVMRSRDAGGDAPPLDARPRELDGVLLNPLMLRPTDAARLDVAPQRTIDVALTGGMMAYDWGIGGAQSPQTAPIELARDEHVRLRIANQTMMWHPIHVHGHTAALATTGVRRDTVRVRPHQTVELDLVADNPGMWMLHCHNAYHLAVGMATDLTVT